MISINELTGLPKYLSEAPASLHHIPAVEDLFLETCRKFIIKRVINKLV